MSTAFNAAYDAYQLRKQSEHLAHLRQLRDELARVPNVFLRASARPAVFPKPVRG